MTQTNESRLRHIIRNGKCTSGHKFAHWFDNHYVIVRRNHVELWYSETGSSAPSAGVMLKTAPRTGETYADFAEIIGI